MKVETYFYVGLIIIFQLSACSLPGPQAAPPHSKRHYLTLSRKSKDQLLMRSKVES
ncbi:hypothetical protein [Brevibacillus brevis]|uniref:hypothetical protein n=1 Tax=Brevibacillus brevis TaxID=1393 RepID=UPI0025A654A7|nr:hypothetical protein [Brevibacillus brevis]WJQ80346.1 hypothetical protein QN310_23220 [Brevibacillus brevis]